MIPIPALLIKTSIIPSFLTMYLIQFLISTALFISHLINSKSLILYFFGFLQVPYTIKPYKDKKRAMDLPIPDEAPVTTITLDI